MLMKHTAFIALILSFFLLLGGLGNGLVFAQVGGDTGVIDLELVDSEATREAEATGEASLASRSAELEEILQQRQDKDITETTGQQKGKLASFLDDNPPAPPTWHNVLQYAIRGAVANGLPANIVVLIILFPIVTSIIAASRHLIGLRGFGVYVPAVLSVALASTGIGTGLLIFLTVLTAALLFRGLVRKMKLQYLPRTAMLLWGVSLAVLLLLVFAANSGITLFLTISIFPLLIIMLLTENFMETQLMSSQSQAVRLTLETVLIAIIGSVVIVSEPLQHFVILNPELTIVSVAIINILVGKYSGLRALEYFRFGTILKR